MSDWAAVLQWTGWAGLGTIVVALLTLASDPGAAADGGVMTLGDLAGAIVFIVFVYWGAHEVWRYREYRRRRGK